MTTAEPIRVAQLFDAIAAGYRSRGLAPLLALREGDQFARQDLARLLGREASLAERLRTGHMAATMEKPRTQPFTARDVIDFYGFRIIHCQTVGNAITEVIGRAHVHAGTHDYWEWAFICATLASVLAEKLGRHDDEAFAACFMRGAALRVLRDRAPELAQQGYERATVDGVLLWEGERTALGASHLDLARCLALEWHAPETFRPAFEDDGDPDSLAGLIRRAMAVASRCGLDDPEGPAFPPQYVPDREPILDAFVRRLGGPEGLPRRVRSMLSTARVSLE